MATLACRGDWLGRHHSRSQVGDTDEAGAIDKVGVTYYVGVAY